MLSSVSQSRSPLKLSLYSSSAKFDRAAFVYVFRPFLVFFCLALCLVSMSCTAVYTRVIVCNFLSRLTCPCGDAQGARSGGGSRAGSHVVEGHFFLTVIYFFMNVILFYLFCFFVPFFFFPTSAEMRKNPRIRPNVRRAPA